MASTPNWFAIFMLVAWPVVAVILYVYRPVNQATLWTILGAQLLLPVGASIKFEGIPQFDKISIPNLAALVGCILILRRPPRIFSGFGLTSIFVLMSIIGPFITAELNTDPISLPRTDIARRNSLRRALCHCFSVYSSNSIFSWTRGFTKFTRQCGNHARSCHCWIGLFVAYAC